MKNAQNSIRTLHEKRRPQNNSISRKKPKTVSKYFKENIDDRIIESHEKAKNSIRALHRKQQYLMKNAQKTVSEPFMKNVDHRTIVSHEKGQKQYQSTSRKR